MNECGHSLVTYYLGAECLRVRRRWCPETNHFIVAQSNTLTLPICPYDQLVHRCTTFEWRASLTSGSLTYSRRCLEWDWFVSDRYKRSSMWYSRWTLLSCQYLIVLIRKVNQADEKRLFFHLQIELVSACQHRISPSTQSYPLELSE